MAKTHDSISAKLFLGLVLCLSFLPFASAAEKLPYYSDQENPPLTSHEPPYETTRRQIHGKDYYVHIRYPYRKAKPDRLASDPKALYMKLSVGNERQAVTRFHVKNISIKAGDKLQEIVPVFDQEDKHEMERGMEALTKYEHRIPKNVFRSITVFCTSCQGTEATLTVDFEIEIFPGDRKEIVKESIPLFRGEYES